MHGHAAHRSHASRRWPPPLGWDCSFDRSVDRDSSWGTWTVLPHGPWPSASRAMMRLVRGHTRFVPSWTRCLSYFELTASRSRRKPHVTCFCCLLHSTFAWNREQCASATSEPASHRWRPRPNAGWRYAGARWTTSRVSLRVAAPSSAGNARAAVRETYGAVLAVARSPSTAVRRTVVRCRAA